MNPVQLLTSTGVRTTNPIKCSQLVSWTKRANPDSKVHRANMGPTWVLSAPDGPHVGPMNLLSGKGSRPISVIANEVGETYSCNKLREVKYMYHCLSSLFAPCCKPNVEVNVFTHIYIIYENSVFIRNDHKYEVDIQHTSSYLCSWFMCCYVKLQCAAVRFYLAPGNPTL